MSWFVYIVRCDDDTLYTGITTDVAARIQQHNLGKGARYTRSRLPVQLVYAEAAEDRGAALRREFAIKALSRPAKLALLQQQRRVAGVT